MNRPSLNLGDLVEHWTVVSAEQDLVAAKHRDTRLGFALPLKFDGRFGRFPRGRAELHPDAVGYVAKQVGVDAVSLGLYEWTGRTIKRHRAEIRTHLGFRVPGHPGGGKEHQRSRSSAARPGEHPVRGDRMSWPPWTRVRRLTR
ncbi:DUF4158 domain-containing protein [Saccharopolyspora sp. NPDC050389]|uniref:DUF4158 domain-containing protein n=1 Tax=Saccharopolyspora sp. NPDC050389 TaxID=3155516 RepID=UPI0033EC64F7